MALRLPGESTWNYPVTALEFVDAQEGVQEPLQGTISAEGVPTPSEPILEAPKAQETFIEVYRRSPRELVGKSVCVVRRVETGCVWASGGRMDWTLGRCGSVVRNEATSRNVKVSFTDAPAGSRSYWYYNPECLEFVGFEADGTQTKPDDPGFCTREPYVFQVGDRVLITAKCTSELDPDFKNSWVTEMSREIGSEGVVTRVDYPGSGVRVGSYSYSAKSLTLIRDKDGREPRLVVNQAPRVLTSNMLVGGVFDQDGATLLGWTCTSTAVDHLLSTKVCNTLADSMLLRLSYREVDEDGVNTLGRVSSVRTVSPDVYRGAAPEVLSAAVLEVPERWWLRSTAGIGEGDIPDTDGDDIDEEGSGSTIDLFWVAIIKVPLEGDIGINLGQLGSLLV